MQRNKFSRCDLSAMELADILSAVYVQLRALQHTIYRQSCAETGNFYGNAFKVALMACSQVDGISTSYGRCQSRFS